MGLKQEILKLLEENREQYLSGQEIANRLSFSRTAVWKSIKALKEDGYEIDAISNKGSRLDTTCDLLSAEGIRCYLSSDYHNVPIEVHQQIDSTNTEAKKQAIAGSLNPEVVTRNQICAHLLNEIFPLCEDFSHPFLLDEYKSRSNVLGKWITLIQNQQRYEALAEDIDGQGGLKVRLKSGEQMTLNSGEVSIRWR